MSLSDKQIKCLAHLIGLTREQEMNCSECLDHVAEFAENELTGKPIPDALEAVSHHLSLCTECREEYEALFSALRTMKGFERSGD